MNLGHFWSRIIYHTVTQRIRHREEGNLLRKGEKMKICPKCGRETEWLRALSRTDNETMICDECGTKEALDAAGLTEGSSVRGAILGCIGRGSTPQDRTRAKVQATGNRWAIENFNATHN